LLKDFMSVMSRDIANTITELASSQAFPFPVTQVEVHQTHISAVFLAGSYAYKIKKPVKLPFLDFSTPERRRFFCDEELRINRRLAPDVYLGVVPVCECDKGLCFERSTPAIDWAVKMVRLSDDATMSARLQSDTLAPKDVTRVAERIAAFHAEAPRAGASSRFGQFSGIARNIRDNLEAAEAQVGRSLTSDVYSRLCRLTEVALAQLQELIERRTPSGFTRELHGDLRLDHIYLFPELPEPRDMAIIDAIEFNEEFRWIDVVADIAFCVMDFLFHGRRELAEQFADAYFERTNDEEGRRLLPLYTSYRAAVRAKVEGIKARESEVEMVERTSAMQHAQAHWLIALGELEIPMQRPALVLVSGLPGTGKSTVARQLSAAAHFKVIRSDVVRKELAGIRESTSDATASGLQEGIYTAEWTDRTYTECLRRAEVELRDGGRVIVDATFLQESFRRKFTELAVGLGVPVVWVLCEADAEIVHQRIQSRKADASDADWNVYQHAVKCWEPPSSHSRRLLRPLDCTGEQEEVAARALAILRLEHLA
jgi:aminoglycoside phosphotransferase family enzyme/predicted kinase